jgi:uncharacterized protein YkwD
MAVAPGSDMQKLCALGFAALLAACGGGDDPQPADVAPPLAQINCGLASFDTEALARINQVRAAGATCGARGSFAPAPPLAWEGRLTAAAYAHSLDMATHNYFEHTGLDGRTVAERVSATGYDWRAVGENLAGGPTSVQAAINGWMASPDHCANTMNPVFVHVGVACIANAGTTYTRYWTMVLATPR